MNWWVQLQAGVSQDRLLAAIGVNEVGAAKWVLNDYFTTTKHCPSTRSVAGFMKMMDERFKRPAEDLVLIKLNQWNEMRRKKGEGIRMFWIRFDRLYNRLRGMSIDWPPKLLYMKALYALELTVEQRTMVTTAMETLDGVGVIDELRRITIKILDVSEPKTMKNYSQQ